MNSQRLAQLRISPLRVQQGLFASLVLLLVLLATQQWQLHEQNREAAAMRQSLISQSLSLSQARTSVSTVDSQGWARAPVQVDRVVSQDSLARLPQQSRWVF
ncbi:hypothetical protein NJC40_14425 [Pseudomonas sp. 21LCFQ02]|uniref:hypothetical protein n=1 Tax=Pseudomonas sp. 21LCFQ02 TaxID=2957505 RepID=UPI00209AAF1B|nr:hypothetical protein [Pseudomonas sp. 21LCFQ02]MCO8168965.1 hypothetical protein [Pseudomonas sp. 21LCFQ02]